MNSTQVFEAIYDENINLLNEMLINFQNENLLNENILNIFDADGNTPLILSVKYENIEMFNKFISYNADVNLGNKFSGETPLHYAIRNYKPEIMAELLCQNKKIKVNMPDKYLNTSLHYAVKYDKMNIVKMLIAYNADSNAQNKDGKTPLHCVEKHFCLEMVEMLLKNKMNMNIKDKYGRAPLHHIVSIGRVDMVEFLIKNGESQHIVDMYLNTLLHYAIWNRNLKMVELLVDAGVDVFARNKNGQSAVELANYNNYMQIFAMLLKNNKYYKIQK